MVRSAKELRDSAWKSLSYKWSSAVLVYLVYTVLSGVVYVILDEALVEGMGFLYQLMMLPIYYGLTVAFLDNIRSGASYSVDQLFIGFKEYWRVFGTTLLMFVYEFLWMLLLVIPGIVKSYSYAMTYYIMRDEPELQFNAAIEKSMRMMTGHKFDLFYLHLTFIGWWLLCILSLGLAFLWVGPYMQAAQAHFYEDVKAEYEASFAQTA